MCRHCNIVIWGGFPVPLNCWEGRAMQTSPWPTPTSIPLEPTALRIEVIGLSVQWTKRTLQQWVTPYTVVTSLQALGTRTWLNDLPRVAACNTAAGSWNRDPSIANTVPNHRPINVVTIYRYVALTIPLPSNSYTEWVIANLTDELKNFENSSLPQLCIIDWYVFTVQFRFFGLRSYCAQI